MPIAGVTLPVGNCPSCGRMRPVRSDGMIIRHRAHANTIIDCEGSGRAPHGTVYQRPDPPARIRAWAARAHEEMQRQIDAYDDHFFSETCGCYMCRMRALVAEYPER